MVCDVMRMKVVISLISAGAAHTVQSRNELFNTKFLNNINKMLT